MDAVREKLSATMVDKPARTSANGGAGMHQEESTAWVRRAALFELLGRSFSYPDRELARAVVDGSYAQAVEMIQGTGSGVSFSRDALGGRVNRSREAGGSLPPAGCKREACEEQAVSSAGESTLDGFAAGLISDRLEELSCAYAGQSIESVYHTLAAEHTRLFIGTRHPLVSPYGSWWKATVEGKEPVLFLNRETSEVERIMCAAGVGNKPGRKEPLDHIACELEFLQYACLVLAGIEQPAAGAVLDEGMYASFLREHVLPWVADFAKAVLAATDEPFYQFAAELLHQSVAFGVL